MINATPTTNPPEPSASEPLAELKPRPTAPGSHAHVIAEPSSTEVVWPCERFYWGTISIPGLRRASPIPTSLALLFADDVPVPVDELFIIAAPVSPSRDPQHFMDDSVDQASAPPQTNIELPRDPHQAIVCAARLADLKPLLSTVHSLRPQSLPPFLNGQVDPRSFNLLVGPCEPYDSRLRRRRSLTRSALVWTCLAILAGLGLHRRTTTWASEAEALRSMHAESLTAILATSDATSLDLEYELEALSQMVQSRREAHQPVDLSEIVAHLLRHWPVGTAPAHEIQSISLNERRLTLSVMVEGDPSPLLAALKPPAGWSLNEPRLFSVGAATRLSLELTPDPANGGPDRSSSPTMRQGANR
jgi:hypothetical protein